MSTQPAVDDGRQIELFQFAQSHFNEKARWALDWKGIPHRRHSLLPGPHKLQMLRLSGQGQVPVLRDSGSEPAAIVCGSAEILAHLERRFPERPLLPEDASARKHALEMQRWLDDEVGPAVRQAKFFEMMEAPDYLAKAFSAHLSPLRSAAYRALFPVVRRVMTAQMDLHAEPAKRALEATHAALDRIAELVAASEREGRGGHLVGDRFGLADLSAAALLSPAVHPAGAPPFPKPYSPVLERWIGHFAEHPASEWVRKTYASYRGESAERL